MWGFFVVVGWFVLVWFGLGGEGDFFDFWSVSEYVLLFDFCFGTVKANRES